MLLLVKDTKFESKSQQTLWELVWTANCFYWSKIQNLKANHNKGHQRERRYAIAFTGQRYKIWKQITTCNLTAGWLTYCFYWSKIQNLKANHNSALAWLSGQTIAFTGQRYKIWKQITTGARPWLLWRRLLLLVKDTKFESKSQLIGGFLTAVDDCFYWSKIQNLKANHNLMIRSSMASTLLLLVKDTKFESKSQLVTPASEQVSDCFYWSKIQNLKANHNKLQAVSPIHCIAFTGQRYKIWKQITTQWQSTIYKPWLLLLVKDTKFESKSQHQKVYYDFYRNCFYWSKIQNLKANHNRNGFGCLGCHIAFTGQRYKIWKQITTVSLIISLMNSLLLLVKDTKFESKSQRVNAGEMILNNCFYWSKIQNLKANHNSADSWRATAWIAFTGQRYKIWKQITTQQIREEQQRELLLLVKDTKFESKSQLKSFRHFPEGHCFYWSKIQNLKANHNTYM